MPPTRKRSVVLIDEDLRPRVEFSSEELPEHHSADDDGHGCGVAVTSIPEGYRPDLTFKVEKCGSIEGSRLDRVSLCSTSLGIYPVIEGNFGLRPGLDLLVEGLTVVEAVVVREMGGVVVADEGSLAKGVLSDGSGYTDGKQPSPISPVSPSPVLSSATPSLGDG
ncbi:hypothetical protein Dimus_020736 [Dionaea muscipula]